MVEALKYDFTTDLLLILTVQEFLKIGQYLAKLPGQEKSGIFLIHSGCGPFLRQPKIVAWSV